MKKKEDEDDEDEEGEDEEDEVGEDEDEEDVEAVAGLQTAKSSGAGRRREGAGRRREGWLGGVKLQPSHGRRRLRRRVAALQTESRQENPDLQDDVIFLDEIEDNFADYMYALREFQANRELLTRQDKQAMVNELRQWAVAEADEMIKLGDLVAVNEAELEGEEDAEEAAGEEDDEEADRNEDHEEVAGEEESKSDQETTLDMPALTSVMAPNQPDGNLLQTDVDVASQRRRVDSRRRGDHRRRDGASRRRFFTPRRRRGDSACCGYALRAAVLENMSLHHHWLV